MHNILVVDDCAKSIAAQLADRRERLVYLGVDVFRGAYRRNGEGEASKLYDMSPYGDYADDKSVVKSKCN